MIICMIMEQWIHDHFKSEPPEGIGGPVPLHEIEEAEKELGVKLPEDYKEYLHLYGSGGTPMYQVAGLRTALFQPVTEHTFIELTKNLRPQLPKKFQKMIIIAVDYDANPIGFFPGESAIFVVDHHMNNQKVVLAKNFEEFVAKLITEEGFEGR